MISNPLSVGQWKRTESLRSAGRKKLGVTDKDFLVMAVGQIEGRKGVDDFIDIAESLPECKFVWVGGRPFRIMTEGILRLNRKIKKAGPQINFIGLKTLAEMPELYAAGDAFIFPSYQENCPLAPLEAAASGMPVIYRDLKEYKSLYKNPYLKAKDNTEFIQLLKRIINDNAFRLEATSMSIKLLEQFDKNQIRKELISLYESLVN